MPTQTRLSPNNDLANATAIIKFLTQPYLDNIDKPGFIFQNRTILTQWAYYKLEWANGVLETGKITAKPTAKFNNAEVNAWEHEAEIEIDNQIGDIMYEDYMSYAGDEAGVTLPNGHVMVMLHAYHCLCAWMISSRYRRNHPPPRKPSANQRNDDSIAAFLATDDKDLT